MLFPPCRYIFVFLLMLNMPWAEAATIKNVRVWKTNEYTRVVFDLNEPVEHSLTLASNPQRVIVELKDAIYKGQIAHADLLDTSIDAIRNSVANKRNMRFVLDLKASVSPKSFLLKKHGDSDDRLVVDLYPAAAAKPERQTRASTAKSTISANDLKEPVDFEMPEPAPDAFKSQLTSNAKPILIVVDAGHGGEDTGALGPNNMREKDVTLAIARELISEINGQAGYTAKPTRATDIYLPLQKRRDIARDMKADLFISVHADSFTDPSAFGASVFALSRKGATSEAARFLAQRENESDLIGRVGGVSLEDKDVVLAGVLVDLSMTATVNSSLQVGDNVLGAISAISPLHSKHVEQAGFVVLKSPDVPSILVETGFISNKTESKKLASPAYRSDMAQAIFRGVKRYFAQHPPSSNLNNSPVNTEKSVSATEVRRIEKTPVVKSTSEKIKPSAHSHVVVRGDTLVNIAAQYKVSAVQIKKANNMKNDTVKLGQTLKIPAP